MRMVSISISIPTIRKIKIKIIGQITWYQVMRIYQWTDGLGCTVHCPTRTRTVPHLKAVLILVTRDSYACT